MAGAYRGHDFVAEDTGAIALDETRDDVVVGHGTGFAVSDLLAEMNTSGAISWL